MTAFILEERWVPVTEGGERWAPRSLDDALSAAEDYPPGGEYVNGEPWDGIVEIVHEVRYVTEWSEA